MFVLLVYIVYTGTYKTNKSVKMSGDFLGFLYKNSKNYPMVCHKEKTSYKDKLCI